MPDFVLLFRSSDAEVGEAMGTPERAQKSLQTWLAWIHDLQAKGHLKSRGQPLERGGKIVTASRTIIDGPHAEAKDVVLGFNIIEARDLDHAAELASTCPIVLGGGGSVEVRPVMNDDRLMRD